MLREKTKKMVTKITKKMETYKNNHITHLQYLALKEGILELTKQGTACFFYKRIHKKEGYNYSYNARKRMANHVDFIKMYENIDEYSEDLKELFGKKYSKEYIRKIGNIPQIIVKGNRYAHEDKTSELINVLGGVRVTSHSPNLNKRTLHVYGRCGVFGYAVEDSDTMPSYLQKLLLDNGYSIRVINHGLWGGSNKQILHNFIQDIKYIKADDIVVFYQAPLKKHWMDVCINCGLLYNNFTEEYHKYPEAKWCFYDKPGHMTNIGYRIIAELIYNDLKTHNFQLNSISNEIKSNVSKKYISKYLKYSTNNSFYNELDQYIDKIKRYYPVNTNNNICGAIVMNCNPFTLGHKYLIEYASQKVDLLYIFVVEENKSFFSFEDRFNMVKMGVNELKNVVVVPSGKFMISTITFPEYFMKEYVREKEFDVSIDLDIFCRNIAPEFNITIRFAGEEPLDAVTANYNKNMKLLLPTYGIKFCEIPRLKDLEGNVVNATFIRKMLISKDYNSIKKYVPETTYKLLKEKYFQM